MDLFSNMRELLPGPDDPGYHGIKSSICHLAEKWYGYTDYTYDMAWRANELHSQLISAKYKEQQSPVSNQQSTELLKQAVKEIYKHG